MEIEEAINTALEFERNICELYRRAAENASDPAGHRIYEALAGDETRHVAYLEDRLEDWRRTGRIAAERIESTLPSSQSIQTELDRLESGLTKEDRKDEKQMLSKALQLELDTSAFYERMAAEMDGAAQEMFARFLEIEREHAAIVRAEIDYISHTGYWFDFKEFDME